MAAKYSIPQVYSDYREMIAHGDLNAVIVATSDDTHYEITLEALGAGQWSPWGFRSTHD